MESQIIKEDSEFCACAGQTRTRVIYPTLDGAGACNAPPFPEQCDRCGKPIKTDVIAVNFTEAK